MIYRTFQKQYDTKSLTLIATHYKSGMTLNHSPCYTLHKVIQGSHMVSGTRCPAWIAEEVEWEQGSGPKGPMSCRTQGWISICPERAYLRPLEQFSMILNGKFAFFHQFAMLFNRNFTFFSFFINFPCYSMESLHFNNFPCYSMGIWGLRSYRGGATVGRMYVMVHPCVLQDIGPLEPLPKNVHNFGIFQPIWLKLGM